MAMNDGSDGIAKLLAAEDEASEIVRKARECESFLLFLFLFLNTYKIRIALQGVRGGVERVSVNRPRLRFHFLNRYFKTEGA